MNSGIIPVSILQQSTTQTSASSPITNSFRANSTTNNQIIVHVIGRDPGQASVPVATLSGMGASWTAKADSGGTRDYRSWIFEGTVVTPGTDVTVSWSGGVSPKFSATMEEWVGLSTTIDGSASASSALGGTSISESVITTVNGDLIIGNCGHNSSEAVTVPAAPWNLLNATAGVVPAMAPFYRIGNPATYVAACSWATNLSNAASLVALKSANKISAKTITPYYTCLPAGIPGGIGSNCPALPALVNPQNPTSFGAAACNGVGDATGPFNSAFAAGDVDVPVNCTANFTSTAANPVNMGNHIMKCEAGAVLIQGNVHNQELFNATGSGGGILNCNFRGPNFNVSSPVFGNYVNDFVHLTPPTNGFFITGSDFNGTGGFTGAVDIYANDADNSAGRYNQNDRICGNTFEHCSYVGVQLTSGKNNTLDFNTMTDCGGWVEADDTGQINTGNVANNNTITWVNGNGWTIQNLHGNENHWTCGSTASGSPFDYRGNTCKNDNVSGSANTFGSAILQESCNASSGCGTIGFGAVYTNETCTTHCTVQ